MSRRINTITLLILSFFQGGVLGDDLPVFLSEVDELAPKLNRVFFKHVFPDKIIPEAFKQAQEDFFDLHPPQLFSEKTSSLIHSFSKFYPSRLPEEFVNTLNLISQFQNKVRRLNLEDQYLVIEKWRDVYLSRFSDYIGLREKLKPKHEFRTLFTSQLTHDTNINRSPDNAILNLSEEEDHQALMMVTGVWIPTYHALKKRGWSTMTTASLARLSYADHKENEVMFLSLAPKFIRAHQGMISSSIWSYRYQNFRFSGDPNTRSVSDLFSSHRLGVQLGLKPSNSPNPKIQKHSGTIRLYITEKFYDNNSAQDASEFELGYLHRFSINSKDLKDFSFNVSATGLESDATPSSDYLNYNLSSSLTHYVEIPMSKEPLVFKETLGYSLKDKDPADLVNGNEESIKLALNISLKVSRMLTANLNANLNFIDYDLSGSTNQQSVALGFTLGF